MSAEEDIKKALLAEKKAERELKKLIFAMALVAFFSRVDYDHKAISIINEAGKDLPKGVDQNAFVSGLWQSYNKWFNFLVPFVQSKLVGFGKTVSAKEYLGEASEGEAKEVVKRFEGVGTSSPTMKSKDSQTPIDMWSGVEMGVRHQAQMEMVSEEFGKPFDLYRISVHPNCSQRCLADQGKIISKTLPAIDGDMWTGKTIDGRKIYSWEAMHARTDKYGYHNFIIDGFNCRHHITPYDGSIQEKPLKEEVEEVNEAESMMRGYERSLRTLYGRYEALIEVDSEKAKETLRKWKSGLRSYEAFASKHKLTPEGWRTKT